MCVFCFFFSISVYCATYKKKRISTVVWLNNKAHFSLYSIWSGGFGNVQLILFSAASRNGVWCWCDSTPNYRSTHQKSARPIFFLFLLPRNKQQKKKRNNKRAYKERINVTKHSVYGHRTTNTRLYSVYFWIYIVVGIQCGFCASFCGVELGKRKCVNPFFEVGNWRLVRLVFFFLCEWNCIRLAKFTWLTLFTHTHFTCGIQWMIF